MPRILIKGGVWRNTEVCIIHVPHQSVMSLAMRLCDQVFSTVVRPAEANSQIRISMQKTSDGRGSGS